MPFLSVNVKKYNSTTRHLRYRIYRFSEFPHGCWPSGSQWSVGSSSALFFKYLTESSLRGKDQESGQAIGSPCTVRWAGNLFYFGNWKKWKSGNILLAHPGYPEHNQNAPNDGNRNQH